MGCGSASQGHWAERARTPRKTCGHRSPQLHPSQAKVGKKIKTKTKPIPHSCSTRASSAHFSLLKIFLNKELPASGRPKPSPTGSQMPGWVEAVSFSHDTGHGGRGAPRPVMGGASGELLPSEASRRGWGQDAGPTSLVRLQDWGQGHGHSPAYATGGINQGKALGLGRLV